MFAFIPLCYKPYYNTVNFFFVPHIAFHSNQVSSFFLFLKKNLYYSSLLYEKANAKMNTPVRLLAAYVVAHYSWSLSSVRAKARENIGSRTRLANVFYSIGD